MKENKQLKPLKVLFVEDDPLILEQLGKYFTYRFKESISATNGEEGLKKFREEHPDLIITDIQMPVMTGLEMIVKIREEDKNIPIVVVTAFSNLENLRQGIELKVDRFISKPTRRHELDEAIEKATETIIQQRELAERDKIIQTILGWHPYFSIICDGNNIEHISRNLLNFLGYESSEEFIAHHDRLSEFISEHEEIMENSLAGKSGKEILEYLLSHDDKDHVIYLHSKKDGKTQAYGLKSKYFNLNGFFLLAFVDPRHFLDDSAQNECKIQNICDVCKFD